MRHYAIMIFLSLAVLYLLAALSGCTTVPDKRDTMVVILPTATPKPVVASVTLPWGHPEWTVHLLGELNASQLPDLMPKDLIKLCPKYDKLSRPERRDVWAHLVVAMAKRESGWKPENKYQESFKGRDGKYIVSRGLLQISQSSANSYGCGIEPADELHDPLVNLSCAVKIIDRWVRRDGVMMGKRPHPDKPGETQWLGCARYWSVCRSISGSYEKVRAMLAKAPGCV